MHVAAAPGASPGVAIDLTATQLWPALSGGNAIGIISDADLYYRFSDDADAEMDSTATTAPDWGILLPADNQVVCDVPEGCTYLVVEGTGEVRMWVASKLGV